MDKEKIKKIIKYSLILFFSAAYLIIQAIDPEFLPDYDFIWTSISVIIALAIYFYNDSIFCFSIINNIWNTLFHKPQVTWEMYYSFQTNQEDCFESTSQRLLDGIQEGASPKIINSTDEYIEYEVEKPDIRKYSLSSELIEDDTFELTCYYKCTLSYKKSKLELDEASIFFGDLFTPIGKLDVNDGDENPLFQKPIYVLKLSFSGFNPVYGLMVKRLNQNKIDNFSLNFQEESAQITIEKNCMSITCNNLKVLKEISKNYLALSDIT